MWCYVLVEKIVVYVEVVEVYLWLVGEVFVGGGEEVVGNVGE